ncbi:class II myosin [Basidiobolus ranarum]|uniref:Class II myosin n=1 Tax=Basidiobolus ranarum TaxID=34480 RepID=A0ABR2WJ50_9FUNG
MVAAEPSENPLLALERVSNVGVADAVAHAAFAERKWVWVEDEQEGYIAGYITKQEGDKAEVHLNNDQVRQINVNGTEKMNPPKFDKVEDMADLAYLNEASVVHNLRLRYHSNLIYTYSGLFLVAVNPYYRLPIYSDQIVKSYKNKKKIEMPPHVFAISDAAYYDMLQDKENQSILITGESGAGKTENTKKVIQYLTAIATDRNQETLKSSLEQQILRANPILESFGNAQTIRNNNSSRFGKFIRIEFNSAGHIAGANIERYVLEKSRITQQNSKERNYHIFYQFMKGAPQSIKDKFLIEGTLNDYTFTKQSRKDIAGVADVAEFKLLQESMDVMGFSEDEQLSLFRVIASILHLGNIELSSGRDEQAQLLETSVPEKICHVLGIPVAEFIKCLLKPKMLAGRDWVVQARTVTQVVYSIEALARTLFERMFDSLIERINVAFQRPGSKTTFIGVLDIAGFEIFDINDLEQLFINYTNERLQQFFNKHMFVLEQEEYKREGIEWKFIDFGLDLQPTIDLIEKANPIGILSCLDEECIVPKASDKTFTEKLHGLWKGKSSKYEVPRFKQGFILHHYASKVEYSTDGWLDKNKDPLNENITQLLGHSTDKYIASLFTDCLRVTSDFTTRNRTKKGAFRTVAQRHKEQLSSLMKQLYSTEPHFVRCILPNEEKKAGKFQTPLVLEQLRCNGVLEGIRIVRQGFPNRLPFSEFRQRYEILAPNVIPRGFMDGKTASHRLLEAIQLDKNQYRIGTSKVFFRAGVLAELENVRDEKLSKIVTNFQSLCRGYLARKFFHRKSDQLKAIQIIQKNARIYVKLREWPWWKLYSKVKPLLNVTRVDEELKKKEEQIKLLEVKVIHEEEEKQHLVKLKSQLESEMKKVEELLSSERNVAMDKEEILRRTQEREAELEEELTEATTELRDIELQYQEVTQVRLNLEQEMLSLREQLDEDNLVLERFEKEKSIREEEISHLQSDLKAETEQVQKLITDRKSLEGQLLQLQKVIESNEDKEGELLKVKSKLQASITELEEKFAKEVAEKTELSQKRIQLESDLKLAKTELAECVNLREEIHQTLKRKENELQELQVQLKSESSDKMAVDKQRREILVRMETLESELENERSERAKSNLQKTKLESEIRELHTLIETKLDEETKQSESRRLRDAELSNLREQLSSCQAELEENRRKNTQMVDNLKKQLEDIKQENDLLANHKATFEKRIVELEITLEEYEKKRSELDKAKRQIEFELQTLTDQHAELQAFSDETLTAKRSMDEQYSNVSSRVEEYETTIAKLERERNGFQRQLDSLSHELEEEARRKNSLELSKKKLDVELADTQARLEEVETSKTELQRRLSAKNAEFDQLQDKYQSEAIDKNAELQEVARKSEKELVALQSHCDDLQRQCSNFEKSKIRLTEEIEDLKFEIEGKNNVARAAEKISKQIKPK